MFANEGAKVVVADVDGSMYIIGNDDSQRSLIANTSQRRHKL